MTHKDKVLLRIGLLFVAVASVSGIALIVLGRDIRQPTTSFELLVFTMSSVALLLAIIQSIAIERQMREIKRSSKKLSATVKDLEVLISTEKKQNSILKKDMELDEQLVKALKNQNSTNKKS
jgi:hypothetical protein